VETSKRFSRFKQGYPLSGSSNFISPHVLQVTVTDENGRTYEFPCKEWLSETQGGGKTERLLRLQRT